MNALRTFQGWTVDPRLRQFRKTSPEENRITFLDFNTPAGDKLLEDLIDTDNNPEDMALLNTIWR